MTAVRDQLTIRPAQAGDLARVAEIYNVGIAERVATFETSPRTLDDIRSWVDDGQPFIVAIDDDEVIGWAHVALSRSAAPCALAVCPAMRISPTTAAHGAIRMAHRLPNQPKRNA